MVVDGQVLGLAAAQQLRSALDKAGIALRTDLDLLTEAWPERPALPAAPVYEHLAPQATRTRADKLAQVREAMARHGATHHFVSTVDDIAWITNLRGADVDYNPVFLAHLLIDAQRATLFVGAGKIDAALPHACWPRRHRAGRLRRRGRRAARLAGRRHAADRPAARHAGLSRSACPKAVRVIEAINPSTLLKSRKSDRRSRVRARGDGARRRGDVRVLRLVRSGAGAPANASPS